MHEPLEAQQHWFEAQQVAVPQHVVPDGQQRFWPAQQAVPGAQQVAPQDVPQTEPVQHCPDVQHVVGLEDGQAIAPVQEQVLAPWSPVLQPPKAVGQQAGACPLFALQQAVPDGQHLSPPLPFAWQQICVAKSQSTLPQLLAALASLGASTPMNVALATSLPKALNDSRREIGRARTRATSSMK